MATLREMYLQNRKPEPLGDGEYADRQGAFRVANMLQKARPQKVVMVFNIFGSTRWFVRSLTEPEARRVLEGSKQTKPVVKNNNSIHDHSR